jgi:hypothetical protein
MLLCPARADGGAAAILGILEFPGLTLERARTETTRVRAAFADRWYVQGAMILPHRAPRDVPLQRSPHR